MMGHSIRMNIVKLGIVINGNLLELHDTRLVPRVIRESDTVIAIVSPTAEPSSSSRIAAADTRDNKQIFTQQ